MSKQKPTISTSIRASSIVLAARDPNTNSYFVDINNENFSVERFECTESFYQLCKQLRLTRDKVHDFTLYLNSQGEIYTYDKTIKPAYRFMENNEEEDKNEASDSSGMIITYDSETGETNVLRPFASVVGEVRAKLVSAVAKDFADLRSEDVLPGGFIIDEVRERGKLKSFYIQR